MKDQSQDRLHQLAYKHKTLRKEMRREFRRTMLDEDLSDAERQTTLSRLLSIMPSDFFDIHMVSQMGLHGGATYIGNLTQLIRLKKHMAALGVRIAPGANDKSRDYALAKKLGVRTPETHQIDSAITDVLLKPRTVVKPMLGAASKGVYTVDDKLKLSSLRTGNTYDSLPEALGETTFQTNRFRVEELVTYNGMPAPDLKVFSFYGKTIAVLEIRRGQGKRHYCWYDQSGTILDPHSVMRPTSGISYFHGDGFDPDIINMQRKLAESCPVPFLRIDFLKGDEGVYLGEITPHPGFYSEGITDEMNSLMGIEFENAWARLLTDLLAGKTFSTYNSVYNANY